MASTPSQKLLLLLLLLPVVLVLSLLSDSAAARPCKSFFISSYSFSIKPHYRNPNPNPNPSYPSSSGFVTIITEINQLQQPQQTSSSASASSSDVFQFFPTVDRYDNDNDQHQQIQRNQGPLLPFGLSSSYDMTSLRDRAKDILSVVVALLFGVGCGAFTAVSMYLVWSFFSSSHRDYYEGEFDDDIEEDGKEEHENFSPKKMGYVKIAGSDFFDEIAIPAHLLEEPVGR